jgi:hypothetical protein
MLDSKRLDSYIDRWDGKATVRSHASRALAEVRSDLYHFPQSRQPLSIHPMLLAKGEDTVRDILLQSCYKYMEDIALTETDIVCRISTRIANGQTPYTFDPMIPRIALTVMTDECYHAHVARNFIRQLADITMTPPIAHPRETELSMALTETHRHLPAELHEDFDLLAVAIAENTLTREIVDLRRDPQLDEAFTMALSDHLSDEAQHSVFFQHFIAALWPQIPDDRRTILGRALPAFLVRYLGVSVQRRFDTNLLGNLGFAPHQAVAIVEDCHDGFEIGPAHPMMRNIVRLLSSAGVLSHGPTRAAFVSAGLLAA